MTLSTDTAAPGHGRATIAYNLAALTLLVLLASVGVAYLIDQAGRAKGGPLPALGDTDAVIQTIAGRELTIPLTWFRYGEQMKDGFASQADLTFQLDLQQEGAPAQVDVTLMAQSRARSSGMLLDRVYLHQFGDGDLEGVEGLVGKPLLPRDGYAGESVWYDPLSPTPFVAKCMATVQSGMPDTCLRTVHLSSGLAAVISFDATVLADWQRFDGELALWLGQIGAL